MIRVLITCVGSGVGQSVVDCLKTSKERYYLIGSDQNRFCFPIPDCDNFVALPRLDEANYIEALLDAVVSLDVQVVIPGHDLELALLAKHRGRFQEAGAEVIVGDVELVRLLRDKLQWARHFRKYTKSVVASCLVSEWRLGNGSDGVTLPAIAKPPGGSASSGVVVVLSPEDLTGIPDSYVLQTFLFPAESDPEASAVRSAVNGRKVVQLSEISVQLAFSKEGELIGRFASRNRLKSGVPVEIHPLDCNEVWTAVDAVLPALKELVPCGPINLQGRVTDEGLIFFEMNPRFTGITGNRAQFGFNEVSLLIDNFLTGEKRRLFVNHNKVGVRQVACRTWPRERFLFLGGTDIQRAKTVLVIGGTSWLARHFIRKRVEAGDEVVAVCRTESVAVAKQIYEAENNIAVLGAQSPLLKDAFASADVLVNFASARPPHGPEAIAESHTYQLEMLDHAEVGQIANIVNISSQSVYGFTTDRPVSETDRLDLREPYAFSHFAVEEAVRSLIRRNPSVTGVSLRLARLFGPATGLRQDEFIHRLIKNAVLDASQDIYSPNSVLGWLDIRDAIEAINFFVDEVTTKINGDAYNIGTGSAIRVGDLVQLLDRICRERMGRPARTRITDGATVTRLEMSFDKATRLGWHSRYSLEKSVGDLFEYFLHENG